MNTISFMTANYVARQLNFEMPRGWGQGEKATNAYYHPLETFGERFDELLQNIRSAGFEAIDLWLAHLNPNWATNEHIRIACDLLTNYSLPVISLAGWLGSTTDEFEATCRLAAALDCKILGASTSLLEKDRAFVIRTCNRYGVRLALENHSEKTVQEFLDKMGDPAGGVIAACVDTGWFGTQGYDAARALEELGDRVLYVHLKDVLAAGAHDTCAFGQGIVPVEKCVRILQKKGYSAPISVEHEPEHFDPMPDCIASSEMLKKWLVQ